MLLDFPKRLEIELSSACNLQCIYCPRKYVEPMNEFIGFPLFKKIVDEASFYPDTVLVLHRRGESLLHPDLAEICKCVKGRFKEIQLATNATLLDNAKARLLIDTITFISFSIDIPEVFNKIRIPADYKKVETNILRFIEINNKRVKTQVSMVKTADTPFENIVKFKSLWKDKVDRVRIYEEHSRNGRFGSLKSNRGKRLPCVMPFYELLVYCNGKVGRCNHDWNGMPMGDLNISKIKSIWNSPLYENLRSQHNTLNISDEVCKDCDSWYPEQGQQGTGEILENEK